MMTNKELLLKYNKDAIEQVTQYNNALRKGDFNAMSTAEEEIKRLEKEYSKLKTVVVFEELKTTDNPIKSGIIMLTYPVMHHKTERENGTVVGIELNWKDKMVDIVKLAQYCKLDYGFKYQIEKFNQLMCLRAAQELKLPDYEIKSICKSYYMDKLSKEIDLGGTPTSNTQVSKALQRVCDAIYFDDNGSGKNVLKISPQDTAYLLMVYTKKGKNALTVATSKHQAMIGFVTEIMNRMLLDKGYTLEYKLNGNAEVGELGGKPEESKAAEGESKAE